MPIRTWQKSSYCAQGDSCVHVAADADHIILTESADPRAAIVTTTPDAFSALISFMNRNTSHPASPTA
ncbi:DUF397 domain-containing protein [Streptomyces sp. DSM 118878]